MSSPHEPRVVAAKTLLHLLARSPRAAGSPGEQRARQICMARLTAAGFSAREAPFEYSAFPGRWATPVAGVLALATIAGTGLLGAHGHPARALLALLVGLGLITMFARWSAQRAVLDARLLRRRGVNLVATRGIGWPRAWLVAHLDSKWQPISIGVRAGGIVMTALACIALGMLAICAFAGVAWAREGETMWTLVTIAGAVGALPIVASVVGNRSPGALDNASGVASVILAAESLPPDAAVGVLLTSAEELGLAGARAWAEDARTWSRGRTMDAVATVAINCDGVDDDGMLTVMRSHGGEIVIKALTLAATAEQVELRIRQLLPGVLVDAIALADGGWQTTTVSRGTVRTLLRIHTSRDTPQRMTGVGIAEASRVLARAVLVLSRRR